MRAALKTRHKRGDDVAIAVGMTVPSHSISIVNTFVGSVSSWA